MTRSIALIACDHGFGHVRRLVLIGNELVARGAAVTLFARRESIARFRASDALVIHDLRTETNLDSLRSGTAGQWVAQLPSLDTFDLVVSDNLVEVLAVRSDAVLSGSFFWHHVVEVAAPLRERCETLVARTRPRMIASDVFAMPELGTLTVLSRVGLCADEARPESQGTDLLVAVGGTSAMEEAYRTLIASLGRGPRPPFDVVWVEPRLFPGNAPMWMQPARFDRAMYRRLLAVVCRAGIGTLTDSAWAGARPFMTGEAGNSELRFNAARFVALGIGEAAETPATALRSAFAFALDTTARRLHAAATATLDFDGVAQTARLLMMMAEH